MPLEDLKPAKVEYPETDGQPMAESDLHRDLMLDLITAVKHRFRGVRDVYVSGNLLIYFVKGDPRMSVPPDFFAVRGRVGGASSRSGRRGRVPELSSS